jgi:uncharacterized repeat protein (TIGR03803 family)
MQRQAPISLFRTIVLAGIAALTIVLTAPPLPAQNSAPQTAVQAAKMPKYAPRLARPANQAASRPSPRPKSRSGPWEYLLYDNGPINGNVDAWAFNAGFIVSDSYTVTGKDNPPVEGMSFGVWLFPGDTLQTAELSITSGENGGTSFFDQTVPFTQSGCVSNQYGFNVCTVTTTFYGPEQNGTFWVTLQNASVTNGDPVYWDENSGPSQAYDSGVGTIPSESFSVLGSCPPAGDKPATETKAVTVPPSPTQSYRVIYNFTGRGDGRYPYSGLTIDAAGNLYGTTTEGGSLGYGTAFKLSSGAAGWLFTRLYSFDSENGGTTASTFIFGPDGRLIGTSAGGTNIGELFSLSPPGRISPSVFSNWINTLLYGFTGGNDGLIPSGSLVLDSAGDIFGTTQAGGVNGRGTLYKFTTGGLQVLHAFRAFPADGETPIGVVGSPDALYGVTFQGGSYGSGTFFTTAGGYQVLHSFNWFTEGNPMSLAADPVGNLYGSSSASPSPCEAEVGTVFSLSPPDWSPFTLLSFQGRPALSWISTDTQGSVYGTTAGASPHGGVFKLTCCWTYTDLHDFSGQPSDGDYPMASPVVDAQGNIYGTTAGGGTYGLGIVWEISP